MFGFFSSFFTFVFWPDSQRKSKRKCVNDKNNNKKCKWLKLFKENLKVEKHLYFTGTIKINMFVWVFLSYWSTVCTFNPFKYTFLLFPTLPTFTGNGVFLPYSGSSDLEKHMKYERKIRWPIPCLCVSDCVLHCDLPLRGAHHPSGQRSHTSWSLRRHHVLHQTRLVQTGGGSGLNVV